MIGEHPRMVAYGPYGTWVPAFAYDLTGKELASNLRSRGLVRYGKRPGSNDEDTRPIGLAYKPVFFAVQTQWATNSGGVPLVPVFDYDGNYWYAYQQPDATPNAAKSYTSPANITIGKDEGWSLSAFINEHSKTQLLKLHQWRWGVPGAGYVFQLRNGTPEIAIMSEEFNETDLAALHVLWAVDDPSLIQLGQIDDIVAKIFINFETLNFEKGLGRDDWFNTLWTVTFVPEPRGVLHIILEGGDATSHENPLILDTKQPGLMWPSSRVQLFTGGGSFYFRPAKLQFERVGRIDFGPFATSYWLDALGDVSFARNAYYEIGKTNVSFEMLEYEGFEINFGFRCELSSTNRTQTPWLYGLSARLAPGERDIDNSLVFDTDDLYAEIGSGTPLETDPILDIEPYAEGPFLERTVTVRMSDTFGNTTRARPIFNDRLADVTIDGNQVITEGIVATLEQTNMRALSAPFATIRTSDQFQAGGDSELVATIKDGWHILKEVDCEPPPILDGMALNDAARAILAIAGYSGTRVSGIPAGVGKKVSAAPLGEDWMERPDGKCADALRTLFESYGYGQRFYQGIDGIWYVRPISNEVIGSFTSSGLGLNLFTEPGKLAMFKTIDILHDSNDFYNHFVVVGGKDGEITAEWTNWGSVNNPNDRNYLGRKKTYRLVNNGLGTMADVQYALRSLIWMYGRSKRYAQFESFFQRRFNPGDLIECDGIPYEIEGLNSASWAKNIANFALIERANQ